MPPMLPTVGLHIADDRKSPKQLIGGAQQLSATGRQREFEKRP